MIQRCGPEMPLSKESVSES